MSRGGERWQKVIDQGGVELPYFPEGFALAQRATGPGSLWLGSDRETSRSLGGPSQGGDWEERRGWDLTGEVILAQGGVSRGPESDGRLLLLFPWNVPLREHISLFLP